MNLAPIIWRVSRDSRYLATKIIEWDKLHSDLPAALVYTAYDILDHIDELEKEASKLSRREDLKLNDPKLR